MKLPDKVYEFIKWLLVIVIPAFLTLISALQAAWHWDIPMDAITITITACATFLGVILGISTHYYNKDQGEQ